MSKQIIISKIAAELGVSVNTVYRTINYTGLVKSDTQKRILEYISKHNPELFKDKIEANTKIITTMMQIKPEYYWQASLDAMRTAISEYPYGSIRMRTIFYSGIRNQFDLKNAFTHFKDFKTDALIVVPICSEYCSGEISQIAQELPVVIFNEYGDFGNCYFSAHGDGYEEGCEAANIVRQSSLSFKNILVLRSVQLSNLIDERIKGFSETIHQNKDCSIVGEIDISEYICSEYNYNTTMAAVIARLVSNFISNNPGLNLNVIYIPDGLVAPVCAAVLKIGRTDIRCFGHEFSDNAQRFFESSIRGGYVKSDIYTQSYRTVKMLADKLLYNKEVDKKEYITSFESCLID